MTVGTLSGSDLVSSARAGLNLRGDVSVDGQQRFHTVVYRTTTDAAFGCHAERSAIVALESGQALERSSHAIRVVHQTGVNRRIADIQIIQWREIGIIVAMARVPTYAQNR